MIDRHTASVRRPSVVVVHRFQRSSLKPCQLLYETSMGRRGDQMPIYGKNPSKTFFFGTGWPISTKLGMKHRLKYYNVFVNHDPVKTLAYI